MLKGVVEKGTATAAGTAGRPAAGKTGTAEEDTAAWFAGYTPDLATVVAVMGQDPVTAGHKSLYGALGLPRMNGGGAPAEIWGQYTREALKGTPVQSFSLRLQPGAWESQPPSDESTGPSSSGDPSEGGGRTPDEEDGGSRAPGGTGEPERDGPSGGRDEDATSPAPTGGGGTGGDGTSDGGTPTGGGTGDGGSGSGSGGGGGSDGDSNGDGTGPGGLTGSLTQSARRVW